MAAKKRMAAKKAVIVETGGDWLKLAEIEPSGAGIAVSKLHLEKVGDDPSNAAKAVAQAWKSLKLDKRNVVVCLPRQMVNIRMIELPSTEPAEIEDMIELQVGKQTPYSKDEIVYDYKILGSWRSGYTRVMMAIIQRSALRERYYVLEEAGIEAAKVSVSSEALLNWYACAEMDGREGAATALLDIDSFYSDFLVISDRGLVFTRSILMGANQLLDDADNFADKFSREVKSSLEICRGEQQGLSVSRILIAGAGQNISGIAGRLTQELGIKCDIVDSAKVVRKMPASPSVKDARYKYVSLTPLIGAGLSVDSLEFNLIPDSVRLRKGLDEKARNLTLMGMLIMTVLVCLSLVGTLDILAKRACLQQLQTQYTEMEPKVAKVQQMANIVELTRKNRDPKQNMLYLLSQVPGQLGDDIRLESIEIDTGAGSFLLEGNASSTREIRDFVKRLDQLDCFRDVMDNGAAGSGPALKNRYKFQITGKMEKTRQ